MISEHLCGPSSTRNCNIYVTRCLGPRTLLPELAYKIGERGLVLSNISVVEPTIDWSGIVVSPLDCFFTADQLPIISAIIIRRQSCMRSLYLSLSLSLHGHHPSILQLILHLGDLLVLLLLKSDLNREVSSPALLIGVRAMPNNTLLPLDPEAVCLQSMRPELDLRRGHGELPCRLHVRAHCLLKADLQPKLTSSRWPIYLSYWPIL